MKPYHITFGQFQSILAFISLMSPSNRILDHTPDYIVEKFSLYCGDPGRIPQLDNPTVGVHAVLVEDLLNKYMAHWHLTPAQFVKEPVMAP